MTTSESFHDTRTDGEIILAQLPADYRELADEMGPIRERPAHLGAQVKNINDALRLVLRQAGTSNSLRKTVAQAEATDGLSISDVPLQKWFIKRVHIRGGRRR